MPGKNTIKQYVENGYYHVYNRGVEKRIIFEDEQDYKVFLGYLKEYLSPPPDPKTLKKSFTLKGGSFKGVPHQRKNYKEEIELVAYCLMPNHFHLLLKQNSKNSMEKFMRSIATRYSMYFNRKYDRVGKLFQGHYKASLITKDPYLLHLTRYIHLNPSENTDDLLGAYSSYSDYLSLRNTSWVKPDMILAFFNQKTILELEKVNSYKDFVEKHKKNSTVILGTLTLED